VLVRFLIAVVDLYTIVLIVRIVFSWMPEHARANQFYDFLHAITEPVMAPFRRVIPPMGGIDFSPILLFLILQGLSHVLRLL
jgi:YggT family protein